MELRLRNADHITLNRASLRNASLNTPYAPCKEGNAFTLQDTLTSCSNSPLDLCIVNHFYESCTNLEKRFVDDKVAGFSDPEIRKQLGITYKHYDALKKAVREKASKYLI